jgi:hypothetical protein
MPRSLRLLVLFLLGGAKLLAADYLAPPLHIATEDRPALLGGVTVLVIKGAAGAPLTVIPYFAWNNRGLAPMTVWLPETAGP